MKFYALFILLIICIDYAILDCVLTSDDMNVEKSVCLKRKVGDNEVSEETDHNPNTCCLVTTSGKVGDQPYVQSYCAALEKEKVSELEKIRNEKYANLGTTKIECEDSSATDSSKSSSSTKIKPQPPSNNPLPTQSGNKKDEIPVFEDEIQATKEEVQSLLEHILHSNFLYFL